MASADLWQLTSKTVCLMRQEKLFYSKWGVLLCVNVGSVHIGYGLLLSGKEGN